MSLGGSASYVNGPCSVSRSCVPMATRVRFLQLKKSSSDRDKINYL